MTEMTNADVLRNILHALYTVACRRTTHSFATTVIGAIIKNLQQNYAFLRYVNIENLENLNAGEAISISPEINSIEKTKIGSAIEAIIRIVYMDLVGKTGLFFMKELKEQAGEQIISELKNFGVDLALLQTEQRYLHRQYKKKKQQANRAIKTGSLQHQNDVSLLGYTWKNVGSWKYDPIQKTCVLYSKEGLELDRLNLDTIIENYVKTITEDYDEQLNENEQEISLSDKEIELLKALNSRDMDTETATVVLHISKNEFEQMVRRLLQKEMLHYVSFNEIELTEEGISFISQSTKE